MRAPRRRLRRLAHPVAAGIATFVFVLPVYIALANAFKTQEQILDAPLALPAPFTLDNLIQALQRPDQLVQRGLLNSVIITVLSVGLLIPLAAALSYWIHGLHGWRKGTALGVLALGLMVPPQVILQPTVFLLQTVGLNNTHAGLILSNIGGGYLSFAVFVYVGFLRTVPEEIMEAARVDGASELRVWWKIVMPLVRPATATVAIFLGLWVWNDFLNPLYIIGATKGVTITTGIYVTLGGFSVDFAQLFGIMFLAAVIPVVGYLVTQREFIHGLMSGASK